MDIAVYHKLGLLLYDNSFTLLDIFLTGQYFLHFFILIEVEAYLLHYVIYCIWSAFGINKSSRHTTTAIHRVHGELLHSAVYGMYVKDQCMQDMSAVNAVKVNSLEFVGLVWHAPMSTCVVNAMEMTNMILRIDLSVLTGSFLMGKLHTMPLLY